MSGLSCHRPGFSQTNEVITSALATQLVIDTSSDVQHNTREDPQLIPWFQNVEQFV